MNNVAINGKHNAVNSYIINSTLATFLVIHIGAYVSLFFPNEQTMTALLTQYITHYLHRKIE